MRKALRLLSLVIVVAGAIALAAFMVRAGSPADALWWPLALAFLVLNLVPHILLLRGLIDEPIRRSSAWIGLVGSLAIVGLSMLACMEALVWHPDPKAGLVFVIMPVYLIPPAALIAFLIRWRERRAAEGLR